MTGAGLRVWGFPVALGGLLIGLGASIAASSVPARSVRATIAVVCMAGYLVVGAPFFLKGDSGLSGYLSGLRPDHLLLFFVRDLSWGQQLAVIAGTAIAGGIAWLPLLETFRSTVETSSNSLLITSQLRRTGHVEPAPVTPPVPRKPRARRTANPRPKADPAPAVAPTPPVRKPRAKKVSPAPEPAAESKPKAKAKPRPKAKPAATPAKPKAAPRRKSNET